MNVSFRTLGSFAVLAVFSVGAVALEVVELRRVSVASDGTQGNDESDVGAAISPDGRFVSFGSRADNLVQGDSNGVYDVFVHDSETGQTRRVSIASDGTEANGPRWKARVRS